MTPDQKAHIERIQEWMRVIGLLVLANELPSWAERAATAESLQKSIDERERLK